MMYLGISEMIMNMQSMKMSCSTLTDILTEQREVATLRTIVHPTQLEINCLSSTCS